jgi:predicted RNase H-like HicB family nuclease
MRGKRTIVIGGLAASLARGGDDGKKQEQAVLSDAAKRLGVTADELKSALSKAEDAQLDEAVKDGRLTQEQADEIKKHRHRSGRVLGPGAPGGHGGPGFGFRGPGPERLGGPGGVMDSVADAIGISVPDLFSELRDGKTLEQVAKAHGKSLDDVKNAAKKALEEQLDAAVKADRLTRSQADDLLERLPQLIDHLGERGAGGPPGFGPPPGDRQGHGPPQGWQ